MANRKSAQPPLPPPETNMDVTPSPPVDRVGEDFQLMKLRQKGNFGAYFDSEMLSRKGCILFYINVNSAGAAGMIGCTRTNITDACKVPAYLERNYDIIRQNAVGCLQRHFQDTQCSVGVTETISYDDYSVSFSWASVTQEGFTLNNHGKYELPMGCAAFDKWVQARPLYEGSNEKALVVNVHIMLQEQQKRKAAVIKRAREDEERKAEQAKKPRFERRDHKDDLIKTMVGALRDSAVNSNVQDNKRPAPQQLPPPQHSAADYPYLPVGMQMPPEWNKTGRTPVPSE